MMASTVVSGLGSPVARLAISAADAHPSASGVDSQFSSACALRSPGRIASPSSGFAGARRICVESLRVVSPRRDGGNLCQAYARTTTYGETEEKEEVANPSSHSRIGREQTLYDVLGVTENAGVKDIKSAFRQLARRFHPDVNAEEQRDECTRDFMEIHAAYTTLSDPQSKAAYDLQLSMQRFQRNGYGNSRVTLLTSNWDSSTTTTEATSPGQSWNISVPTGFSSPSGYSAPSSYSGSNTEWRGRRWETDQCW